MELVNDNDNKVKLFIDERVLNTEYFRFHPNENGLTIRIRYERTLYVEKNVIENTKVERGTERDAKIYVGNSYQ